MTKIQRRIFMFSFIFLFLIIAPILVLFAQGYRFDKYGHIFVYSGSITVKSWPRDVDVYINNKKQSKGVLSGINSSYTFNSIRPGRYNIKCQKDGYTSWEKNIDVHSGISTEFWNVILFPAKENQNILTHSDKQINQYFISPRNDNEIVFFASENDENKIYFINTQNNQLQEVYTAKDYDFLDPSEEENVEWSSDNKRILIPLQDKITKEKTYIVASLKNDQVSEAINFNQLFEDSFSATTVEKKEDSKLEKVRWMFNKNEELVALTKGKELYYFYLNSAKSKILLDNNVDGFDFAGNRIYYCQLPNNIIWEIKDNNISTKRQIVSQSIETDQKDTPVKMIVYDEYRIAIIDSAGNLIVYNEEKETGEKTLEKVHEGMINIQFSDDGKKLLFWTDNEIWMMMLRKWEVQPIREKNKVYLITRFSEPIRNVQWMDNYENAIFSVGSTIKSAEVDTRDHINIIDINTLNNPLQERQMFYNKQNQTLYFIEDNNLKSSLLINQTGILGF